MTDDQPLNVRQARAGLGLLEGKTIGQALRDAGYAPSTAKKPTKNGLTPEKLLTQAKRLDPTVDSEQIIARARRVLDKKLAQLEGSDEMLEKARPGA